MHIGLIIPDLVGGGAERSVLILAQGLIDRGHNVDVVLFRTRMDYPLPEGARLFAMESRPDKQGVADVPAHGVRLHAPAKPLDWVRMAWAVRWNPLCVPEPRHLRQVRALASYLEREQPDCALPNRPGANIATLWAARLVAEPPAVIPILRGFVGYEQSRPRDLRRYRRLFAGAAHFVGVSQGVSASLAATMGLPGDCITTIYNPVVTSDLHVRMEERPDHPWLLDREPPVILAAGRLSHEKDFFTLIKAFARVAAQRPCRLIILGEGGLRKELEGLVAELRLTDRVSLPGWVENPFAFMSRASLFVLSSTYEGLPGVLIQALACGCPCVSTDCPAGPAEVLQDGRVGPLVPVGDDAALAQAMARILHQPPDRQALRQRAAYFSVDRAVTAYEDLLSTFVSARPHAWLDGR